MTDAGPAYPTLLEAAGVAFAGGALAGISWSLVGLTWPAAAIGAANGAISGARRIYGWRAPTGPLAFALDSTWGLPMTTAAIVAHGVAGGQGRGAGYVTQLSERADRLVAVWNGEPPTGKGGGTADTVLEAQTAGIPVDVVWPDGARRG